MDVTDITPSLEKLNVDLDQLEAALKPVLGDVGDVSSKLPLLDKAKLYVMVTYAIESMLFCMSDLHIDLRSKPVANTNHSLTTSEQRRRQGACYFHRVDSCQAVF